jgi:PPM family protein phosphatase
VGDSRAYRLRDGELKLLTSDHSLVEELRRQGRLTDEQAEDHPQRSIITRALGPEREVEVDTMTYQARPGDVYLLCSDGLTTMLRDDQIAAALAGSDSLDEVVSRLVREANEAGGRDNITVVAFRLEEAEVGAEVKQEPTLIGPAAEEAGLTAGALGGVAAPPRPRRWPRRLAGALAGVAIVAVIAGGAVYGLHHVYFLGTDSGGRVALYRGLPYDLPLGIKLYSEVYAAPVQVAAIPGGRQDSATNHTLRSRADAISLIDDLQVAAEPPVHKPKRGRQAKKAGQEGGGQQGSAKKNGSGAGAGGGGGQ